MVASQRWLLRLIRCLLLLLCGRFPSGLVFLQGPFETMFISISDLVHQQLESCAETQPAKSAIKVSIFLQLTITAERYSSGAVLAISPSVRLPIFGG